jgi:hypothetical protein
MWIVTSLPADHVDDIQNIPVVEAMGAQVIDIIFACRRRRNGQLDGVIQHRPLRRRQIQLRVVLFDAFDQRVVVRLGTESLSVRGRSITATVGRGNNRRNHFPLAPGDARFAAHDPNVDLAPSGKNLGIQALHLPDHRNFSSRSRRPGAGLIDLFELASRL